MQYAKNISSLEIAKDTGVATNVVIYTSGTAQVFVGFKPTEDEVSSGIGILLGAGERIIFKRSDLDPVDGIFYIYSEASFVEVSVW